MVSLILFLCLFTCAVYIMSLRCTMLFAYAQAHRIASRSWVRFKVCVFVTFSLFDSHLPSAYSIGKTLKIHVIAQPNRRIHCARVCSMARKTVCLLFQCMCNMAFLTCHSHHCCVFIARSAHKSKQRLSNLNKWKISFFHFEPPIKAVPTPRSQIWVSQKPTHY